MWYVSETYVMCTAVFLKLSMGTNKLKNVFNPAFLKIKLQKFHLN